MAVKPGNSCWFVYILQCNDGTYYTGATNNLDKRVEKHNSGKGAKYTRNRLPVKLVYSLKCNSKSAALKEEYRIKQLSRFDKIKLIKGV